ncbi:MAG: hypothetical protein H6Q12_1537 [Bacteroidetes bacterium]|nr:hypothetical protein [Bacteroidota bacterium]
MKKIILGAITLFLLTSCNGKKPKIDPFESLTNLVDSASAETDSTAIDSVEETPKATKADETFDDFIYSFASNKKMQQQRIHFPLTFINGNATSKIEKRFWKTDHLAWILNSIVISDIKNDENENFIEFFHKFATDSIFQRSRTREPLTFVTTDPDDDFSILETTMEVNQWFAFAPRLPKEKFSNINYGQSNSESSNTKILSMKGLGNGFSNTLYFKRQGKLWEFYKFEDLSN